MSESLGRYEAALAPLVASILEALYTLEHSQRFADPSRFDALRARIEPRLFAVGETAEGLREMSPPDPLRGFHERWLAGADLTARALRRFASAGTGTDPLADFIDGMKAFARAQETLYSIHAFPPLSRYFVEPAYHSALESLDPPRVERLSVGLHHSGGREGAGARAQFCLYVPESYDGASEWPLVVALHGGAGSGREFLWAWLREARGRRFLLLAPTAAGPTWSLQGPDRDGAALRRMVAWVADRWRVKRESVLLTGLSDGATFCLLAGLAPDSPYTALAPIAGVLHPINEINGNLAQSAGRRVYLVHGALDWMFPVQTARTAYDRLMAAGADATYRELADLSHTYPREENGRILEWFDPVLALPETGASTVRGV